MHLYTLKKLPLETPMKMSASYPPLGKTSLVTTKLVIRASKDNSTKHVLAASARIVYPVDKDSTIVTDGREVSTEH
jgi:hypothetical protein